jgi:hypothetical protein
MRRVDHLVHVREMRNVNKILDKKPAVKRPLGRVGHRSEDNTRMGLKKKDEKLWTGFIWLRVGTSCGI